MFSKRKMWITLILYLPWLSSLVPPGIWPVQEMHSSEGAAKGDLSKKRLRNSGGRLNLTTIMTQIAKKTLSFSNRIQTNLKEAFFFGIRFELFWQKRFEPAVIVVWPWELVRLKDHQLEKVSIFYFVVIRPIENFLEALEVQI